jgi:subtilisin-like proprotein convertase family protein
MRETADKIDQAQGQYVNGHSPKYGHGRINALKALGAAAGPIGGGGLLERVLYLEHRINRAIPDQDRIEDTIPFPLEVTAKSVEVGLDIEHTYRGDLRVSLITPQGQEIVLSDRAGGSQDNLVATFRSTNDPGPLRNTAGQPAKGEWRLRVSDLAAQDVGKLRKWSLAIGY